MSILDRDIQKFNEMYTLPAGNVPNLEAVGNFAERVQNFSAILHKELLEGQDILEMLSRLEAGDLTNELCQKYIKLTGTEDKDLILLTMLADWLGDIAVYACSELKRYGMSPEVVIRIIMQSNFTKLDECGKPIINSQGKVEKGPYFVPPERELARHIADCRKAYSAAACCVYQKLP